MYIYKTMKEFKRIILTPKGAIKTPASIEKVLSFLKGVSRTMSFVDDYITVKGSYEQVSTKTLTIKSFRDKTVEDFQDSLFEQASDSKGTLFLICKN